MFNISKKEESKKNIKKLKTKSLLFSLIWFTTTTGIGIKIGDYLPKNKEFRLEQTNNDDEKQKGLEDVYFDIEAAHVLSLSPLGKEKIEEICNNKVADIISDFDERYIDGLTINKETATKAYGKIEEVETPSHSNNTYYNQENDSIDWEALTDRIYENTKKYVLKNPITKALTKKDLEEKVKNMETFVTQTKEEFPELDLEEIACKLKDYSFVEKEGNHRTPFAETSVNSVTYYKFYKELPENLDFHEDFHIFVVPCPCVDEKAPIANGIGILTSPKLYTNEKFEIDWNSSSRYNYSFLEEIYAELYSSEKVNDSQSTYLYYDEVLDTIQLALGLNEEYKIDSILAELLYHEPISFIKNFPVYGENKETYFLENLRMLQSFNILFDRNSMYLSFLYSEGLNLEDAFYSLNTEAISQLSKIFFNNLIMMNEKHFMEMSLENNYCMTQLFVNYLQKSQRSIIAKTRDSNLVTGNSTFLEDMDVFFDYLSEKYSIEKEKVEQGYFDYDLQDDCTLPVFLSEDKREYYQNLIENRNREITEPYSRKLQKTAITNSKISSRKWNF